MAVKAKAALFNGCVDGLALLEEEAVATIGATTT